MKNTSHWVSDKHTDELKRMSSLSPSFINVCLDALIKINWSAVMFFGI